MSAVDKGSDEEFTKRRKTMGYIRAPFKLYSARRNTSLLTSCLVVEEQGQHIVPLWINGRALPIVQERVIEVINAAKGNVVHYAQCTDANDAKAAVKVAAAAFPAWSTSGYIYRREILLEFANIIERCSDERDTLQTIETSSMLSYGAMGSILASRALREIASSINRVLTGEIPSSEDNQ